MGKPKIAVCSSAYKSNVAALLKELAKACSNKKFEFIELPHNNLEEFRFKEEYDGLILCHSIHNRRLALTDVMDALYNEFLPYANSVYGKENICVIAHDFDWQPGPDHETTMDVRMESLRLKQQSTFELSSLVLMCGKLDDTIEMIEKDLDRLKEFMNGIPYPVKRKDYYGRQIDVSPVTVAKIIILLVLLIVGARLLASLSMVTVSMVLFILLLLRWLMFNDVITGASQWMGKVQSSKIQRQCWSRLDFQQVPWQKIPSKVLGYYSRDNIPKLQAYFEITIRMVIILWLLMVIFGVTNNYAFIRLTLVLIIMEPLGCWLWMTAGRMKKLKPDFAVSSEMGTARWFAVPWTHVSPSFWLYHIQVLTGNPDVVKILMLELNVFFCMYFVSFGNVSWSTGFVVLSVTTLQPLGYWLFFNAGKKQSLLRRKGFDFETPKWARVELVEAPISFWKNFVKIYFSSEQLRPTLVAIVNGIPWFFVVFYYETRYMTLGRHVLVVALLPLALKLLLTKSSVMAKVLVGSSEPQWPEWSRVPVWQVPQSFWLHYGRDMINHGKLSHKVIFAVNIVVWLSLISFGDVGKATLVRFAMILLLEPMANIILLAN